MPRGGDKFGSKGRKKAANWGRSDRATNKRMDKYNNDKDDEKFNRDQRRWERVARAQPHPQVCPVCLDKLQTRLLINCGAGEPYFNRGHGLCEDCAPTFIGRPCPICRGPVIAFKIVPVEVFA